MPPASQPSKPSEVPVEPVLTLGWKDRNWHGAKVACGKCRRRVRGGLVHYKDKGDPPVNVLCRRCFALPAHAGFYVEAAAEQTTGV